MLKEAIQVRHVQDHLMRETNDQTQVFVHLPSGKGYFTTET